MMNSVPLGRRDKQVLLDFDNSVREFHKQFIDQQRILDLRTDNKVLLVNDLQEFFKRRSELDMEYGKNLDRLCERFTERLQKQRATYGFHKKDRASFVNLWSKLLIDAKFKAKTATTLSEIYSKNIVTRLSEIAEDIQRIAKSVKDTHTILQQEILNQINQLQNDMKTYYMKLQDYVVSKGKFHSSEESMKKAEDTPLKKGNEKRLKQLEKTMDKRRARMADCQQKAIHGRNGFILSVDSVSSVLSKYYNQDISDIVLKFDHNFHNSFSSTLQAFIGAETRMANAQIYSANSLTHTLSIMDADNDMKMFLEDNQATVLPNVKFIFVSHSEDEVQTITADENIEAELSAQHRELHNAIKSLQVELSDLQAQMEKRKSGLDATYKKYDSEMNGFYHIDMTPVTGPDRTAPTNSSLLSNPPQQLKIDKEEWETGLLTKFREKIMSESLQVRTQSKYDALTKALGEIALDATRHVLAPNGGRRTVKLFGTSLKMQLDDTGQEIPDLVESCAKYVARFGLRHQGIFRIPGASQEIADLKVAFEEGRDPLSGLNHWKDINAVAGLFKAYFRESAEPLFPYSYNQDYLRTSCITKLDEQIAEAKSILTKIPNWNLRVIRYLLKFLNLISQYSEQNKMPSHNLAVVFGPTLFRIADNENLLTKQGQINVFIDLCISEFYQIFPDEPHEGDFDETEPFYSDEGDVADDHEDEDEEEMTDEDTDDTTDAIALHDFTARSPKEVSFSKGDKIRIFTKTTKEWWDARVNGKYGYVPVSYIKIVESRPGHLVEPESNRKERKKSHDRTLELSPTPASAERKVSTSTNAAVADRKVSTSISPPPVIHGDIKKGFEVKVHTDGVWCDSEAEHCGNVFASIDPTCTSPSTIRRVGSDRLGNEKKNIPVRTHSDKSATRPLSTQNLDSHGENVILEEAGSKAAILVPPVGGKSIFYVSQHDLQASRLRSPSETIEDKSPVSPSFPEDSATMGRVNFKEKQRGFSVPTIVDRPLSAALRPILGQMQIDLGDRPSPVPNFKPPPPPPAIKPKPSVKKKDTPPDTTGVKCLQNDEKDVTHL